MKTQLQRYRSVQATSCNQANLLLLVYDKTLAEIQKAILLLESGDNAGPCLVRAHLGVAELDKTLNFDPLPELAEALHKLYLHVMLLLGEGLSEARVESLRAAHRLLWELRQAWEQASRGVGAA